MRGRERARLLLEVPRAMPISLLLQHLGLALRLYAAAPALDPDLARAHIEAAQAAATAEVSAEVLLAIAFIESRFEPATLSRVEGKRRIHGRYASAQPPARLDRRKSMFCGPLQTRAKDWDDCLAHRQLPVAYAAGVRELTNWLRDRHVRGDMTVALLGYGCGYHGVKTRKCNRYPNRVLWQARQFAGDTRQAQARRAGS